MITKKSYINTVIAGMVVKAVVNQKRKSGMIVQLLQDPVKKKTGKADFTITHTNYKMPTSGFLPANTLNASNRRLRDL